MKEHLLELLDYHYWAMRKTLSRIAALPGEIYREPLVSVFPSLSHVVKHLHDAEQIWCNRISEGAYSPSESDLNDVREATAAFDRVERDIGRFARAQDPHKVIRYRNSKGEEYANSLAEIIYHLVNHGTYHRGNITAMLRQLGHQGVATDYIVYLREKAAK